MSRRARGWWHKQKRAWCTKIGRSRRVLAKGERNKALAQEKLRELAAEQTLLTHVNGTITVAALCDAFLEDALHNLEKHACQKFVDLYAARAAHPIEPQDIARFARLLKSSLNPTSQTS